MNKMSIEVLAVLDMNESNQLFKHNRCAMTSMLNTYYEMNDMNELLQH